ncbi:TorD/DmsD family molecular chaperone [Desulfolithobacter sp.]
MTDVTDRELGRIRLRFLDLIKSFFIDEPDAERMSRWRGIVSALAGDVINPVFDQAVQRLGELLEEKSLQEIQEEYYHLFIDPTSEDQINTVMSYYVDGRSFGPSLVEYRDFLQQVSIVKDESVKEPEDSLVLMLDALATLIEEQTKKGRDTAHHQATLLHRFLDPLCQGLTEALKATGKAPFYTACGDFLRGYLLLEKGLLDRDETLVENREERV